MIVGGAIALTLVILVPYLVLTWLGRVRPHVISWVIWGLATVLAGCGQWTAGAGWGAAPIAVSGTLTCLVAICAWLRRHRNLTDASVSRFDLACLAIVLATVPLWMALGDPLWSILIVTIIDLIGFGPTLRRIRHDPQADSPWLFAALATRNGLVVIGVDQIHLATVVFPASIGAASACTTLYVLLARWRSSALVHPPTPGTATP
jgi:hypothetical protein